MEDITLFDSNFMEEGISLLRALGVPDDIARVYVHLVPLRLMGVDEETAKKLACSLEAAATEGAEEHHTDHV